MKTLLTLTAGVAASLALSVSAASAKPGDYSFNIMKDDLETSAGVDRTLKRLENFAQSHCGTDIRVSLAQHASAMECARDVTEQIIEKVDHSALTTRYYELSGFASSSAGNRTIR